MNHLNLSCSYEISSSSWWFSTTICIKIQLLTSRFILVWLDWQRIHIPKQETWITLFESEITSSSTLLWDLFNFHVILHYYMYLNQTFYPAINPGLIRMTKTMSYSLTPTDLFNFLVMSTTLYIQIKLFTSRFIHVWLEWRGSCHFPKHENWDHFIWKWNNFFIITPMRFIKFPDDSPLFMYLNQVFYITIHLGLIRMMKNLSCSQTGKLGSPDMKVG